MKICIIQSKCRFLFVLGQLWTRCFYVSSDMYYIYTLGCAWCFSSRELCYVHGVKSRKSLTLVFRTSLTRSIDLAFKTNTKSQDNVNWGLSGAATSITTSAFSVLLFTDCSSFVYLNILSIQKIHVSSSAWGNSRVVSVDRYYWSCYVTHYVTWFNQYPTRQVRTWYMVGLRRVDEWNLRHSCGTVVNMCVLFPSSLMLAHYNFLSVCFSLAASNFLFPLPGNRANSKTLSFWTDAKMQIFIIMTSYDKTIKRTGWSLGCFIYM